MVIKSNSPLYKAFKENEICLTDAIKLAAIQSAARMGKGFNTVYHRSFRHLFERDEKVC